MTVLLFPLMVLLVSIVACGPKPGRGLSSLATDRVSGFIFETEISGRLGTKVLSRPGSIALDHAGNVVICDTRNHRLIKVTPDGAFVNEIGGFGFSREEFNHPTALTTSDGINFYLLDSENHRIVRLDADLNWIAEDDLSDVPLDPPIGRTSGIAVNSFGDLFVSDPDNKRVVRFDSRLTSASELTESGGFLDPGAMAVDDADNLYVVNRERKCIAAFDGYDNFLGNIAEGALEQPSDICVGVANLLYVADGGSCVICVFSSSGEMVYSFGSIGAGQYRFRQVHSLCVGSKGKLFVSDHEGDRVVVYRPNRP